MAMTRSLNHGIYTFIKTKNVGMNFLKVWANYVIMHSMLRGFKITLKILDLRRLKGYVSRAQNISYLHR